MVDAIFRAAGGLGLFLLGMSLLNDGLQKLASRAVTGRLAGWTDRPLRGALAGMVGTALIQSSTATTVTAVGLVGAGLMSFRQALGVIFGANVGTTITGWMVALFGFQLQLGEIAWPLVLVAALLRLAGRHRAHTFATALGGFALVFVGISVLQAGLAGLTDRLTPASFPPDTVAGRLQLVALGTLVTLVTQSSSAGVAVALTGVHVGTVTLGQAAALVIGMDIGTTATALAASIGRSVAARRTGLAHLIFNLFTAAAAFALWPLYHAAWNMLAPPTLHSQAEIALVGFHTLFNLIGLAAVLPLTTPFARLVTWFVPESR